MSELEDISDEEILAAASERTSETLKLLRAIRTKMNAALARTARAYYVRVGESIQSALNAASADGCGEVRLAAGTHTPGSTLEIPPGITLCGPPGGGSGGAVIQGSVSVYPLVRAQGQGGICLRGGLRDLTLDGADAKGAGANYLVDGHGWYLATLERVTMRRAARGLRLAGPLSGSFGSYYNTLIDCAFSECTLGLYAGYGSNNCGIYKGRFVDNTTGVHLAGVTGARLDAVAIETGTTGILLGNTADDNDAAPVSASLSSIRLEGLTSGFRFVREVGTQIRGTYIAGTVTTAYDESARQGSGTGATPTYSIFDDDNVTISGGTRIKKRTSTTAVITPNPTTIAANATQHIQVTIAGVTATDTILVTPPAALPAGLVCMGIPGSGVVYVCIANVTAAGITPGAQTYRIDVMRN